MKYIDTNIDAITGEITITEKDFTAAEIKAQKEHEEKCADMQIEAEAKAEAKAAQRQAILDRLGLTAEEAALLLS